MRALYPQPGTRGEVESLVVTGRPDGSWTYSTFRDIRSRLSRILGFCLARVTLSNYISRKAADPRADGRLATAVRGSGL